MTITIRPLDESDLPAADQIFRQAFSKFLGMPDPQAFTGDAEILATRFRADPAAALGAYNHGALAGSCFAARWGSFGFLGPVSVRPDLWDQGVAKRLVGQAVALLDHWSVRQAGLFTFPQSPKHIALYQKFGFWPQYLTAVMSKQVQKPVNAGVWSRYSQLSAAAKASCLTQCAELTDRIFAGLDVRPEIVAIDRQGLGDIILIHDGAALAAFAACHMGAGSEAGTGQVFVKFAAVQPGAAAPSFFERLLDVCSAFAAETACRQLVAGVNTTRHQAYRMMIDSGFRAVLEGVAMLRPNETGYNRPDCFVIDDLR